MKKTKRVSKFKLVVFISVTIFLSYLALDFLYEVFTVIEYATGSYFGSRIRSELQQYFVNIDILVTLLEIRFVVSLVALMNWLYVGWRWLKKERKV